MTPEPRDAAVRNSGAKPRRPHKKARTGCANCRRRRVKCSEEKPQCRACFRRGVECQYPSLQARSLTSGPSPVSPDDGPSPNSTSTQQSSQHQQILPLSSLPSITFLDFHRPRSRSQDEPFASFRIQDMALLHHWTISTSLDIYKNSGLSATCQVAFPQIAFKHPFVMDALLGLTALHVAYLDRQARLRHIADAVHYHNEGLNGFNDAMRLTSNDTADALFVWSSLNLLYVFGISGRLGHDFGDEWDWGGRKDRVLGVGWIPMVRGVQTVVQPIFPTVRSGPLSQLLNLGNWDEIDPDKATDPEDERFCRTRGAWENSSDAPTYEAALWTLRRCRQFMAQFVTTDAEAVKDAGFNRAWQGPFLFFPFAPEEYFTLLRQRQPSALILYAFFGALLHSLNDSWFMEGWGYDIVEVIHDLLGSYWKPWIGWPLDVVGIH